MRVYSWDMERVPAVDLAEETAGVDITQQARKGRMLGARCHVDARQPGTRQG